MLLPTVRKIIFDAGDGESPVDDLQGYLILLQVKIRIEKELELEKGEKK